MDIKNNIFEEKKQKTKRKDNDPAASIMRKLAEAISILLAKTPITPNQLTIANFVIFVPIIIYLILQGSGLYNLIALGLIVFSMIIDFCDGSLARLKGISTPHGGWLDKSLDLLFQSLLFGAVILSAYWQTGNFSWIITGFILFVGQIMANYMGSHFERDFGFDVYSGSKRLLERYNHLYKVRMIDRFLKNIIVPMNFVYIFVFTARYLLVLGLVLNMLQYFVLIYAITINLRWFSMFLLYSKTLSGTSSKLKLVQILREIKQI